MDELQAYIEGEYREDVSEIAALGDLVAQVLPVFSRFFNKRSGQWPYEVPAPDDKAGAKKSAKPTYSCSTISMITHMASVTLWGAQESVLVPAIRSDDRLGFNKDHPNFDKDEVNELQEAVKTACTTLARLVGAGSSVAKRVTDNPRPSEASTEKAESQVTHSSTYGSNDPFTLAWIIETLRIARQHVVPDLCESALDRVRDAAKDTAERAFKTPDDNVLRLDQGEVQGYAHAFPLLRCIQLAFLVDPSPAANAAPLLTKLQNIVYQQISLSSIRGSEFDAAELVFALEGTLRLQPEFDRSVIGRAFQAIERKQRSVPNWRPLKPYIATPRGLVLLPISVEVANSLLRICDLLDRNDLGERYFSSHISLFRNYTQWLRSRITKGKATVLHGSSPRDTEFRGWHSEHILKPGSIHLWMTSQCVLYLMHYASMLRAHVAFRSLRAGRFAVTGSRDQKSRKAAMEKAGDKPMDDLEPLIDEPDVSDYKISRRIQQHYIDPRRAKTGKEKHYSMLLYGPPGTRKTTLAERLAEALGYDLITITPSDFVKGGESEVESRAKAIFKALEAQSEAVVLLDEIDRLLLDRDSTSYREQGDIFQFMTPGMLTKLNSLRKSSRVIFIIATNYAERIDPALKRRGRIDDHFLLLPPDASRRQALLQQVIEKKTNEKIEAGIASSIAKQTPLWTYNEYEALVETAYRRLPNFPSSSELANELFKQVKDKAVTPTIRLANYRSRLTSKEEGDKPFEEFLLLAHLILDAGESIPDEVTDLVRLALEGLEQVRSPEIQVQLKKLKAAPVADTVVTPGLRGANS